MKLTFQSEISNSVTKLLFLSPLLKCFNKINKIKDFLSDTNNVYVITVNELTVMSTTWTIEKWLIMIAYSDIPNNVENF